MMEGATTLRRRRRSFRPIRTTHPTRSEPPFFLQLLFFHRCTSWLAQFVLHRLPFSMDRCKCWVRVKLVWKSNSWILRRICLEFDSPFS
uniref:Uncharacterized protein n=1 Tax=Cucumis melo TaxID=3656 RepID=A0A9I9DAX3_CUCME